MIPGNSRLPAAGRLSYGPSEMEATVQPTQIARQPEATAVPLWLRRARLVLSGAIATVLGLLPHILHHVGPLAGAALFAGVGGSLLFGAVGLVAAVPFLLRLHRRCGNWRLPAAALALFATIFSISTFVLGPAISGSEDPDAGATTAQPATPSTDDKERGHAAHH